MKIGKAINALKEKKYIYREQWNTGCILKLEIGKCPENNGKVDNFIDGIPISLFNISTNKTNPFTVLPKIIGVNFNTETESIYTFCDEDILAEDWKIIE